MNKISDNRRLYPNGNGSMLVLVIVATGLFLVMLMGGISVALLQQKLNIHKVARAQALDIAEAGVNYYRWHLYHYRDEFCNSETCIGGPDYGPYGPYTYTDSGGENITGYYQLYIEPPAKNGSTIVRVKSVGWMAAYPQIKRTVEVLCGIASWATYATITDGADWPSEGLFSYGAGSEVWGPVHSNYSCIKNDGIAYNLMTSSQDHCSGTSDGNVWGVFTSSDPDYPAAITPPEKPNFLGGRDYGPQIPIISFGASVGAEYMRDVYALATGTDGLLFDPDPAASAEVGSEAAYWNCESNGSCREGFHVTFKAGDKFDLRKVSSVSGVNGINSESSAVEYDVPPSGIIFIKHTVWVDGQMNNGASGTRATILAIRDPIDGSGNADIFVNGNTRYTNYDGTDSLGLIAQRNVSFSEDCPSTIRVDAALLAKYGRRFSPDFSPNKNSVTIFGQTASYLRPYMSNGFNNRYYIYDNNMTFAPPPHYPTTGQYTFISWKEE